MGQRPWQYHGRRASRARGNARPDNGGWPAGKQCGLHRTGLKEAHWGHRQAETTGTLTATAVRRCACEVSSSGIARTARFAFGGDRLLVDRLADHTEPTGCDLARLLASLGVHSEVIAASMIPPASEWQVGHRLAARPSRGHSLDASSTVFGLQSASLDASHRSSNCDTVTPPGALVVLLPSSGRSPLGILSGFPQTVRSFSWTRFVFVSRRKCRGAAGIRSRSPRVVRLEDVCSESFGSALLVRSRKADSRSPAT